jgi:hypothetical protein
MSVRLPRLRQVSEYTRQYYPGQPQSFAVVLLGSPAVFIAFGRRSFEDRARYDNASIMAFIPLFLDDYFLGIIEFFLHTDRGQTTQKEVIHV